MHIVACEVFRPELERLFETLETVPPVTYLEQGLHEQPEKLRAEVQATVDRLEAEGVRRILLAYGLCGRGLAGVTPGIAELVIPRVHDCIPVLLGTTQAQANETTLGGSTYWLSPGWLNYSKTLFFQDREARYRDYEERFGAESAAYLIETEGQWLANYTNACFIHWEGWPDDEALLARSEAVARDAGLPFRRLPASPAFLEALLAGGRDDRFLHVNPGYGIDLDGDGAIVVRRVKS